MPEVKRKVKSLSKALRMIDKAELELYFVAFGLFVMTAVLIANVLLRSLFNSGLIWGNEVAAYSLVIISFAACPVWIRRRGGLRVDALVSIFPMKAQKFALWLNYIILGIFFAMLSHGTWQLFTRSTALTHTLEIPMRNIFLIILLFNIDSTLRCIQVTIIALKDSIYKTDNWARVEKIAEYDDTKAQVDAAPAIKTNKEEANR